MQASFADRSKRAVKLGISAALFAVDSATAKVAPSRRRGRRSVGVVLMYHDVAALHRSRFAQQCDTIVSLGRPVSLHDLHGQDTATHDSTWRIAVTFDDGFRSFAQVALPELEKRAIPSAIFVPTEWARRSGERSDDRLTLIDPDGSPVPMTFDELAELPASVQLGSHSRTHVALPTIDDHALRDELEGSRDELATIAQSDIRIHAFPYGERDQRVDAAAREAGYERCYGVAPAVVRANGDYVVGRVQVDPTDWPVEFRLKALGAYRWMSWWMAAKERLRSRRSARSRRSPGFSRSSHSPSYSRSSRENVSTGAPS